MISSTITIGGKEYGVAGSYGVEVAFQELANVSIGEVKWTEKSLPPKYIVDLIVAASFAYYNGKKQEPKLTQDDVMNEARPKELVAAVETIFRIYSQWSATPEGDKEEETEASGQDAQEGDQDKKK